MFNISDLITRAWNILWRYRVLWVFALLLALSGGAGGGGGGGGGGGSGASVNMPAAGDEWFGGWDHDFDGGRMSQWLDEAVAWFEATVTPMFATEERALRSAIAIVEIGRAHV